MSIHNYGLAGRKRKTDIKSTKGCLQPDVPPCTTLAPTSLAEDGGGSGGHCPAGFAGIGGGCYFHSLFKLNWFRAMEFCHSFGSHVSLACIETREQ